MIHSLLTFILNISLANSSAHAAQFPSDFRWCVSTSGHQIEGGNTASDWWEWEKRDGVVRSGQALDHYNRVDGDQSLLTDLGVTDYRMSIEWSRIEPREGFIDREAVNHYAREIDGLKARRIRPLITLQHFTLPLWVRQKGGFEWSGMPSAFARFSRLVFKEIAPETSDWITINEPTITVMFGYFQGVHPPGEKRNVQNLFPVIRAMAQAHAASFSALHSEAAKAHRQIRVGMAHHLRTMDPWSGWNPMDRMIASVGHDAFNWALPDALETGRLKLKIPGYIDVDEEVPGLRSTQDFLAVNYYSGDLITFSFSKGFEVRSRAEVAKSEIGWDIHPEGLSQLLVEASKRYVNKPILITENGIADSKDNLRPDFLRSHLGAVASAVAAGARVEGYCHWTLLDAFEWNEGFKPRFGLYAVDPITLERRARPSAHLYREIIRANGF